jgi:predicted  nucleic acid-binding Zn-ribbon protein
MNQVVIDLWPVITGSVLTAVFSAAGMYIGFVHRLRTKVAVMEVEVVELKRRVEGHSRKQDDIMSAINGIRNDMNEKLNQITVDIAKIKTTLTIIEPKKEV